MSSDESTFEGVAEFFLVGKVGGGVEGDGCRDGIDFVVCQDGNLVEGAGVIRDAEDCLI